MYIVHYFSRDSTCVVSQTRGLCFLFLGSQLLYLLVTNRAMVTGWETIPIYFSLRVVKSSISCQCDMVTTSLSLEPAAGLPLRVQLHQKFLCYLIQRENCQCTRPHHISTSPHRSLLAFQVAFISSSLLPTSVPRSFPTSTLYR